MSHLLFIDTLRGGDGTGVACIPRNSENPVEVYKKPIPGYDFVDTALYYRAVSGMAATAGIIGHNRAATKGVISAKTSHPFQHGTITLAHNGTLFTMYGLEGTSTVDSERITQTVATRGAAETLPELDGSYALVWHDSADNTINFARNKERPLYLAFSKNKDILYWASEPWMINVAVGRNSLSLEAAGPWEINPGEWHKIQLGKPNFEEWQTIPFVVKEWGKGHGTGKNGQNQGNTGAGTSGKPPKKNTASMDALASIGLKPGDDIEFYIYQVTEYKKSKGLGSIEGFYTAAESSFLSGTVVSHGMKVNMAPYNSKNVVMKDLLFMGKVVSGYVQNSWVTIVVEQVELLGDKDELQEEDDDHPFRDGASEESNVSQLVKGPRGKLISLKDFKQHTVFGCVMCGGYVNPAFHESVVWTQDYQAYCHECVEAAKNGDIPLTNVEG
jgi:hypothetical protein